MIRLWHLLRGDRLCVCGSYFKKKGGWRSTYCSEECEPALHRRMREEINRAYNFYEGTYNDDIPTRPTR